MTDSKREQFFNTLKRYNNLNRALLQISEAKSKVSDASQIMSSVSEKVMAIKTQSRFDPTDDLLSQNDRFHTMWGWLNEMQRDVENEITQTYRELRDLCVPNVSESD